MIAPLCRMAARRARAIAFVAKRGINGMSEGNPGSLVFKAQCEDTFPRYDTKEDYDDDA
jgi:hypothetical protein